MTLREEIARGENVALEFREARPKDSPKCLKAVGAFGNGHGWRPTYRVSWAWLDVI